jgi:hypothetical protein
MRSITDAGRTIPNLEVYTDRRVVNLLDDDRNDAPPPRNRAA